MTGWTVMLRGIGFRAGRSLLVVIIATIAVASAVATAGYVRATQQSVLTDGLGTAPPAQTQLVVGASGAGQTHPPAIDDARLAINTFYGRNPLLASAFGKPIAGEDVDAFVDGPGVGGGSTWLSYRDNVCTHLIITGACPSAPGQVLVSQRSAKAAHIKIGASLWVGYGKPYDVPTATGKHTDELAVRVVGQYTPRNVNDPYWGGNAYFGNGEDGESPNFVRLDTVFTSSERDVLGGNNATVYLHVEMPLNRGVINVDNVAQVGKEINSLASTTTNQSLTTTTGITIALHQATAAQHSLASTIPVVAVPLLLLCLFVLFLVVTALTDERAPEIALAKLRGYTAGRAGRFGVAEMLTLIFVATPLGVALGFGLTWLAAHAILAPGTPAELRLPIFETGAAAMVAGFIAAWLATRTTLRRGVLSLMRRVPQRTGWRAGIGVGLAVAFVAASLVAALLNRTSPIAWLAAPSIALIGGLIASRLMALTSAGRLRSAARRGRIVGIISGAWLARQPGRNRVVAVLTVAVALLVFGAVGWDVGTVARSNDAKTTLGAERVYEVTPLYPTALIQAVHTADPTGNSMAVVRTSEFYSTGYVNSVGVEADRLAKVGVWTDKSPAGVAKIAAALTPKMAPQLVGRGSMSVNLDVSSVAITGDDADLGALVVPQGQAATQLSLGRITPGTKTYTTVMSGCETGCRLIGLTFNREYGGTGKLHAAFRINSITATSGINVADFANPTLWKPQDESDPSNPGIDAGMTLTPGKSLGVAIDSDNPSGDVLAYQDAPLGVPVVVSGGSKAGDPDAPTFTFPGLGGTPQPMTVVDRAAIVPRGGTDAILYDLDVGLSVANRTGGLDDLTLNTYEVWANPSAPADLVARLAKQGLSVLQVITIPHYLTTLARSAPTLSLWFYLFAGGLALVLAVGVVLLGAYVGAAARIYEYAALRMAGVRSGTLRRAVLREYWTTLGITLVVGIAAGVGGAALMLPSIPLVTVGESVGAVPYSARMLALYATLAITVAAMGLVVLLALRVLRLGTPDRLREGVR